MDAREARYKLQVARTLLGTGMVQPERPDKAVRTLARAAQLGPDVGRRRSLGGAIRYPDRAAIVDERGTLTFAEVHRRTNALARELRKAGIGERDDVAIMCRNHRGFIEATVACSKLGAGALYLNTAFAGPQIADVLRRERPGRGDLRRGVRRARARGRARVASASSPGSEPGASRRRAHARAS